MPPASDPGRLLYADEVARARAMGTADKLLEGPRLFERACRLMQDGIRHRHPTLSDEAVDALLAARLARLDDLAAWPGAPPSSRAGTRRDGCPRGWRRLEGCA